MTTTKKYTSSVGRRKSAVTNLKLFFGKQDSQVNNLPVEKFFPGEFFKVIYTKPFVVTKTEDKFYFQAKVTGGGKEGQLESLVLALSRALKKADESFREPLRENGLLTVDARVRQRRMVGTGGKARRAKQSPRR